MNTLRALTHHPLYRRELSRLAIIQPKHPAWIVAAVLGVITLLCGVPEIIVPPPWLVPRFSGAAAAHAAIITMLFSEEALLLILCFAAAVLAGLIGGSTSEGSDDLLMLANVPAQDVLRIRLAAVLNTLRLPILVITLLRILLILLLVIATTNFTFWLYDITSVYNPNLPTPPRAVAALNGFSYQMFQVWTQRLDIIRDHWSFPLWALLYIAQPALDVLMYAAVASRLSARASTRGSGLGLAAASAVVLWIFAYLAERLTVLAVSLGRVVLLDQPFPITLWQDNLYPLGLPFLDRLPYLWSGSIPLPISPFTLMLLVVLMLGAKSGVLWWALRNARSGEVDDEEA